MDKVKEQQRPRRMIPMMIYVTEEQDIWLDQIRRSRMSRSAYLRRLIDKDRITAKSEEATP